MGAGDMFRGPKAEEAADVKSAALLACWPTDHKSSKPNLQLLTDAAEIWSRDVRG